METQLTKSGDEFAIAQLLALSCAKQTSDLHPIINELNHFFSSNRIYIYRFDTEKETYKLLAKSDETTAAFILPDKINEADNLFEIIHSSNSQSFITIKKSPTNPGEAQVHILPSQYNNKRIGCIIFEQETTNDNDSLQLRNYKKHINQIAINFIRTSSRIHQNKILEEVTRTTHKLFENSNESFCRWSETHGWSFLNHHPLHRIGYDNFDLKIENIFGHPACMDSDNWEKCSQALKKCLESGKNTTIDYDVVAPNGQMHTLQSKLVVQKKSIEGNAIELTGISKDISASKHISQQAIDNIDMDTWLLQLNSKLFHQPSIKTIRQNLKTIGSHLGFDRAFIRIADKDFLSTIYAEWSRSGTTPISEIAPAIYVRSPDHNKQYTFENLEQSHLSDSQKKAAKKANYQSQIYAPMYNNGRYVGYFVLQRKGRSRFSELLSRAANIIADTFSMVIAKQQILEKLESSKERFHLAMEAASYGLWELNLSTKNIYLNPTYYSMLGYTGEKQLHPRAVDLSNVHIDDREKTLEFIDNLTKTTSGTLSFESRHYSVSGEVIWILTRGKVVKWDDTGSPLLATGTLTNITHLKKSQMDLQLAYQEAQSARIAKGEFLARMSHEIRTPMNAIIGMAYLTLQTDLSEEQHQYISDIDNAAKSLLQIIDDILDFSKIEAGKLIIENHEFDITKLIHRINERYRPLAQQKHLSFDLSMDENIPSMIKTDSTRLRQILNNLIGNAIKFTDQGFVRLDVKLINRGELPEINFVISDSGIGLEPSQLDTLFEPFHQADGSSIRQFGGTGIGLSISRHLVELMGGQIQASGAKGNGSQFCFSIPCFPSDDIGAEKSETMLSLPELITDTHDGAPPFSNLRGKRVLLVEDNKVNQKVAAGTLKHQNIHVTIANNGTEAVYMLKASEANQFDCILMDIEMPFMGGFEATEAIRAIERHADIPIIAMTANLIGDQKGSYVKAGMNDCISKPIAPEALYQVLQRQFDPPKNHI